MNHNNSNNNNNSLMIWKLKGNRKCLIMLIIMMRKMLLILRMPTYMMEMGKGTYHKEANNYSQVIINKNKNINLSSIINNPILVMVESS